MAHDKAARLTLACCSILLLLVSWSVYQLAGLAGQIHILRKGDDVQTITSRDVENAAHMKADISTVRNGAEEPIADWIARHKAAVAAWAASGG